MKKIIIFLLCTIMTFCATACLDSATSNKSTTVKTTSNDTQAELPEDENKECDHTWVEGVYKAPSYGIPGSNYIHCTLCGDYDLVATPALPSIVEISVKDKRTAVEDISSDGSKKCWVLLTIEIKNISDLEIKNLSGSLVITGMGGIFNLDCGFDQLDLAAHDTITYTDYGFSFDYNSLPTDINRKVYDTPYEELVFNFSLSTITAEEPTE